MPNNTRFSFVRKSKTMAVTCDFDTLSFYGSPTDTVSLIRSLHPFYTVVVVTDRGVTERNDTMVWLDQHEVPYDALVMDEGYHSSPTEFKVAAVEQVAYAYDVVFHLDDDWRVARAVNITLDIPTVVVSLQARQHVA